MNREKALYQLIGENRIFLVYACDDGFVYLKSKKTKELRRASVHVVNGYPYIHCSRTNMMLCTTILKAFKKYDFHNDSVLYKDGNKMNCSLDNLMIVPRTGRNVKPIYVKRDGKIKVYQSAKEACRAMYCSRAVIVNYMRKPNKNSSIYTEGFEMHYATEEEVEKYGR